MAEIVEVDGSGRIVLPKRLRDELGIKKSTKLLLARRGDKLIASRLDLDELSKRLESELSDVDVEKLGESVRKEINEKIAREHPEISPG